MRLFALAPLVLVAVGPLLGGCFFVQDPGPGNGGAGGSGQNQTDADIKQYETEQRALEQHRSMFLKEGASELAGIGTRLFWLEFPTYNPTVHSFETTGQATVNYGFSIGTADTYNYRASEDLMVVAEIGDEVIYHAYAVDEAKTELGTFTLAPPGDEQRWWAYAPDHRDVYVVTTGDKTELLKWTVGQEKPETVLTFEDIGIQVGEFWDFGVDQGKVILIESGRGWSVDLASKKATYLGNKTEADAAWPDTDGVLLETATGPIFFSYATGKVTDVAAAIKASNFKLSETFSTSHLFDSGADTPSMTRFKDHVGYVGSSGIFDFDMSTNEVRPILLDARSGNLTYRSPIYLDDGTVFVKGLVSSDGATGADGPVYKVDFSF